MKVEESEKGDNVVEIHFNKNEMRMLNEYRKEKNRSLVQYFQLLIRKAFVWYTDINER